MATSLEELEKNGPDQENSRKYLPFGKKIVKIGAVDTEIALLKKWTHNSLNLNVNFPNLVHVCGHKLPITEQKNLAQKGLA